MGAFSLLFVLLASLVSTAMAQIPFHHSRQPVLSVEVLPPLPTSGAPEPTTVLTVDCLFCSVTDGEEVSSATEWDPSVITITEKLTVITDEFTREYSTTYGKASETIICAPPCHTLVTVPWKSGESKAAAATPSPIMTSCITIWNTPIPSVETLTSPYLSTSTSCSTTSTHMYPWTWEQPGSSASTELVSTELASSELGLPSLSSAEAEESTVTYVPEVTDTLVLPSKTELTLPWSFVSIETSSTTETLTESVTEEVPVSRPCTTDITVTMTKTITETWESKTPSTATLLRTISTTIETILVEAYSTSTGEVVVEGTKTELTTVEAVSSGTDCSEAAGKCCAACSITAESESASVETISSTFVSTLTTVEEYVSSAGGSVVPAPSETWVQGSEVSSATTSLTLVETTTVSGSGTETDGATSVQTAGAAHVTAAMGVGAIFGIMGLLA
ncbi:hypothetical protein FPOA_02123 [Fusarium poae]|uniref:Ig-like domain-containing protein n=1 Tax=Fusarium poae TaxID=36050 RepID=A0A1B8B623_FUSPO|nr:hypothetical protein FPOA_02123 [Fusarium poae]